MQVGDRLQQERKRLKMSQAEFGQAAGVGTKTQFNYETGARAPDATYLIAIRALGVDVLHVLFGEREFAPQWVLSADEALLMRLWRAATPARRLKAFTILGGHGPEPDAPRGDQFNGPVGQHLSGTISGTHTVVMPGGMTVTSSTPPKGGRRKSKPSD